MSVLLKSVEDSALISLSVRSSESGRKKGRLDDSESIAVQEQMKIGGKAYDSFFAHENIVAAGTLIEKSLREFIDRNPGSTIINLGCGYSSLFSRVDNGSLFWYDVDLPDVMANRETVFSSGERVMELEGDARESGWEVFISKEKSPMVVAEGLFPLLSRERTEKVLGILTEHFTSGYLLCDLWSPWAISKMEKKYPIQDRWWGEGFESCDEFLKLNEKLKLVQEYSFRDLMKTYGWRSRSGCSKKNQKDSRVAVFSW